MPGYVDQEYIDDAEHLTNDNTIGLLDDVFGDVEGEAFFHVGRLRRALLAYEEEMGKPRSVEVSLVETDEGPPLLALQNGENASQVILLAGRVRVDGGDD